MLSQSFEPLISVNILTLLDGSWMPKRKSSDRKQPVAALPFGALDGSGGPPSRPETFQTRSPWTIIWLAMIWKFSKPVLSVCLVPQCERLLWIKLLWPENSVRKLHQKTRCSDVNINNLIFWKIGILRYFKQWNLFGPDTICSVLARSFFPHLPSSS